MYPPPEITNTQSLHPVDMNICIVLYNNDFYVTNCFLLAIYQYSCYVPLEAR